MGYGLLLLSQGEKKGGEQERKEGEKEKERRVVKSPRFAILPQELSGLLRKKESTNPV